MLIEYYSFTAIGILRSYLYGTQPADKRVSAPVFGFSPLRVGFLQRERTSKSPRAASVKSAPSTSAPSKLVPVRTALLKIAPLRDDPLKEALSMMPLEKSAPSKLLSTGDVRKVADE